MSFLSKLKKVFGITETVFNQDEFHVQSVLAPILRRKAIEHLASNQGSVAKGFRGEYSKIDSKGHQEFLSTQSRNGVWGTYIEATALGEALDCHVVVTPIKKGIRQEPICLYRASDTKAPTVHLYNSDNVHWYVKSEKSDEKPTKGDGNCLFNAFVQALKRLVMPELKSVSTQTLSQGLFKLSPESEVVIQHQKKIAAAIRQQPTPVQLEEQFQNEKTRISRLSPQEQKQIKDDHQYALTLAKEEMGYAKKNIFCREASVFQNKILSPAAR